MSSFLPCENGVDINDWKTQLDRIFIPQSEDRLLRLIGPENGINIHLANPDHNGHATLRVTATPPTTVIDGIEINEISGGKCFADVYMFLEQQGLSKWHFPSTLDSTYYFQGRFWMYAIVACMTSPGGAFSFRTAASLQDPSTFLWDRLYPGELCPKETLHDSIRSAATPDVQENPAMNDIWERFVSWRECFAKEWTHSVVFGSRARQPTQRHAEEGRVLLSGMDAHVETVARMRRQIEAARQIE